MTGLSCRETLGSEMKMEGGGGGGGGRGRGGGGGGGEVVQKAEVKRMKRWLQEKERSHQQQQQWGQQMSAAIGFTPSRWPSPHPTQWE
ncbi:unnamed protein product [Pleuronectes platessa]|uniref:Uncharacterized protein n=1 Tax=Pleuronectes platessa TaxID=8262 RepID=A0A9N7V776_PLEPL|nr:unnamed protein product [Pleuronectes platessa]